MNPLKSDDQLGKYRLVSELGAGGMGAVWLAHDTELDRKVALKVLRPALAGDDTAQARLLREARAMAKLRHPNVITVFDAETVNGRDLVAMELIDGENMAGWLSHEHSVDDIANALLAAGRGLAAAHAAGMIHRDFKPHNVLVERGGRVLVTDFGLARAEAGNDALMSTMEAPAPAKAATAAITGPAHAHDLALEDTAASQPGPAPLDVTHSSPGRTTSSSKGSLDSDLTRTGTLLGTPAYMAPEQIAGRAADARADQFAFCVTAWEAFAGKRPFPGDDVGAIAKAIQRGEPAHADKIPRGIRPLLQRGLAADPAQRWPAMDPLLAAFERAVKRPKAVKQWSQAVGLGVFAFVAIFVVMNYLGSRHTSQPSCSGARALAPVYNKEQIAKLLADPKATAQLDRWAKAWTAAYDDNCKKPSDDDFSARTLCLEGERDQISLLVDPKAVHALAGADLAVMLPDPAGCVNAPRVIGPPLPKDPNLRTEEQQLRSLMIVIRGRLLSNGAVDADVLARAKAAVAAVEGVDNPTVRADAMAVKSMIAAIEARNDRDPEALAKVFTLMKQASDLAEAAGLDRTRVQLQLGMLEMSVFMPGYWSELDDMLQQGEAGVEHTKDPVAMLALDDVRAEIADKRGQWSEAIDGFEKVRRAWLARGSTDTYARYTVALATALLNRHVAGDVDRGLAALNEALGQDLGAGTRRGVEFIRDAIAEAVGKADVATINKLGYTRDAGDPNGGTLVATVSGLELPTLGDMAGGGATRHGVPEVEVYNTKQAWRIAVGADGVFTLANLPPGTYSVQAFVNSAAGDLQMIRRDATITAHATTKLDLPYPELYPVTTDFPVTAPATSWGIAIALPATGKPPANVGELQTRLLTAPWWSVATVHTVKKAGGVVAQATLGAFGKATVCGVEHASNNGSDPSLNLGSGTGPMHCQ